MQSFALSNTGPRLGVCGPSPPPYRGDRNNSQAPLLYSQLPPSHQYLPPASAGSNNSWLQRLHGRLLSSSGTPGKTDSCPDGQLPRTLSKTDSCPEPCRRTPRVAGVSNRGVGGLASRTLACSRQIRPRLYRHVSFSDAAPFPRANAPVEAHNPLHPRRWRHAGCMVHRKSNTSGLRIQAKKNEEKIMGNEDRALVGGDLGGEVGDGDTLQKSEELARTRQLVETAMLAATAGLAFFITNLLRLEGYIGCFLPLPPVIASLRWNAAAGRKTTVATSLLLFLIGGPLKAVSYLLLHGIFGMAMGALWSWRVSWTSSLLLCTLVRMLGLILSVAMSSWFIKENLLVLLINQAHASLGQLCVFLGINASPSVTLIVMAVCALVFLNCIVFVFLLHVLYTVILHRLGIPSTVEAPGWIKRSLTV